MKALVYEGPGRKSLAERPVPTIRAPTDAIVKVTKTTICGTDLHILKGDVLTCMPGRILGHEGVGVVNEVGAGVTQFKKGDRVLISASRPAANVNIAARGCIRVARPAAGFSATRSTAHRPNMSASHMLTPASIPFQEEQTRRRSSC